MVWKQIHSVSRYLINEYGDVKSLTYNKIMKQKIDRYGYPCIQLKRDDGSSWYTTIHRLVAMTFIHNPDPDNMNQVNHIDGNKLNNHISNLEWCSARKNINHSYKTLLNNNTNHIEVIDTDSNNKSFYKSIKSFCKSIDRSINNIIPYILNSERNPILGRYIVRILDIEKYTKTSNVENFGKNIYVYDITSDTQTVYPSINSARLFTGLRGLRSGRLDSMYYSYSNIGYLVSDKPIENKLNIPNHNDDISAMLTAREKYLLTPYVDYKSNDSRIVLLDYVNAGEYYFKDIDSCIEFMVKKFNINIEDITRSAMDTAARECRLYCGYGVCYKFILDRMGGWPKRKESEILSSKNKKIHCKYYLICKGDKKVLTTDMMDVLKIFGIDHNGINHLHGWFNRFIKKVNSGEIKLRDDVVKITSLDYQYPDKPITKVF